MKIVKVGTTKLTGKPIPNPPTKKQRRAAKKTAIAIANKNTMTPAKVEKPTGSVLSRRAQVMRAKPTYAEAAMCKRLMDAGIVIRIQPVIGWYIADILIADRMLIIELDGGHHYTDVGELADARRTSWLAQFGFKVLRIPNEYVHSFDLSAINAFPVVQGCDVAIGRAKKDRNRAMYHKPVQQEKYKAKSKQRKSPAWTRVPRIDARGRVVK